MHSGCLEDAIYHIETLRLGLKKSVKMLNSAPHMPPKPVLQLKVQTHQQGL
jgi:hypothetical protein